MFKVTKLFCKVHHFNILTGCICVPDFLYPCQNLLLSVIFVIAILVVMKCYLLVLIFISLITNDIEHLFIFIAFCIYSLNKKICSNFFTITFFWVFFLWVARVLYIFWVLAPYPIYGLQVFPLILWVVFSLSWCPFEIQIVLILMEFNVHILFFYWFCFLCHIRNWLIKDHGYLYNKYGFSSLRVL